MNDFGEGMGMQFIWPELAPGTGMGMMALHALLRN
jgi:hypothetical protein